MRKRSFSASDYPRAVFSARDHVLVDRDGNLWIGKILETSFTIRTPVQMTVTVPRKKIQSVVYENPPTYETDRLITTDGTVLNGVVRPPDAISFKPAHSPDVLVFPIGKVLALQIDGV